jgi:hypothetical protein
VTDELHFQRATDELRSNREGTLDIDTMAYDNTKKHWIEDEIWDSAWGELPGKRWMHEDLYVEGQPPNPQSEVVIGEQRAPISSADSNPELVTDGYKEITNEKPMVLEEVDVPRGVVARAGDTRKKTKGTSQLPSANNSRRSEESIGQVLRSVRSSKVAKLGKSKPTDPNTLFRKQNLAPENEKASLAKSEISRPESEIIHKQQLDYGARRFLRRSSRIAARVNATRHKQ